MAFNKAIGIVENPWMADKSAVDAINRPLRVADNEFYHSRSVMVCHPERSEGSLAMDSEMLRCAQHDNSDSDKSGLYALMVTRRIC